MTTADVPADGEVRIGVIRLAAGRRIRSNGGRGEPVAWATTEPVPDAGRAWAALSEAHAQSGLVPLLLDGIAGDPERPWDTQEFRDPDDLTELDDLDVAELMREDWLNKTVEYWEDGRENEDEDDVKWVEEEIAPFSRRQFPGLALAEDHQLDVGQLDRVLTGLGPARVGLVPAGRPADALPMLGWNQALVTAVPFAAVLRSWENRFGARLLRVGLAEFSVLARRPPRTLESAQHLAAEHWAFCNEFGGTGLHDVPGITASLMNSPVWTFWWD